MPHLLPCRVLVAEVDEPSAAAANAILGNLGYSVDRVVTADDAVASFARQHYGLVLLDWHLPELDAPDAAARIRRLPHGPAVPIWSTSARLSRQEWLAAGIDDVLRKPFTHAGVSALLEQWSVREPDAYEERPWTRLAHLVQAGDREAQAELYNHVARWTRSYLLRTPRTSAVEDRVHDTYLAVLRKIQDGDLREPKLLPPFVFGVVRNLAAAELARRTRRKELALDTAAEATMRALGPNPEEQLADAERRRQVFELLGELSDRDREILTRFYMYEQSWERICAEMQLSATQFRLYKSRALARLGKLRQARESAPGGGS